MSTFEIAPGIAARAVGEGEPVLWFHGYTLDSSSWEEMWSLLPGYRHVGIDLPGHGSSADIEPGSSLTDLGERLGSLCRQEGFKHLVALSFGTISALQVAIDHPALLDSIVLGAPAIAGGPSDPDMAKLYMRLMMLFRMTGRTPALTEQWMSARAWRGIDGRPELKSKMVELVGAYRWGELQDPRRMGQFRGPKQEYDKIAAIESKVLVLVGDSEMDAFKECADIIADRVERGRRVDLPDTDHLCMLQSPELCAPLIAEHLRPPA